MWMRAIVKTREMDFMYIPIIAVDTLDVAMVARKWVIVYPTSYSTHGCTFAIRPIR